MVSESEREVLNKFSKVQNACSQLKNCIQVIYDNALSNEELATMSGGSDIERSVATSAASMISTYLANARTSVDIVKICDYYKFDSDISVKIPFFKQPIISDPALEELVFVDSTLNKSKDNKTNDILKFVGEKELDALISFSLAQKFPYANDLALKNLKSYLLSSKTLNSWASEVTILEPLSSIVTGFRPDATEQEIEAIYSDTFKAYIGALVLDRNSLGAEDLARWIDKLSITKLKLMKFANLRGLYANNLRIQLEQFMVGNKSGHYLQFHHTIKGGICHAKVTLGQTVLGKGEGSTGTIADMEAASNILSNTSLLSQYSVHQESIPIDSFVKEKLVRKESLVQAPKAEPIKAKKTTPPPAPAKIEKEAVEPTKEIVSSPVPVLTAEALNEQIMSQLSSKMASMVSELTSQILQNNNIPVSNDTTLNDIAASQVEAAIKPTPIVPTKTKEQSPKPNPVHNGKGIEVKKLDIAKKLESPTSTNKVSSPIVPEKVRIPIKVEAPKPKPTPVSKEISPIVSKIELRRDIKTNTLEKKNQTSTVEDKVEIVATTEVIAEPISDEKKSNILLRKSIPPIPKIGAPLKAMPKMPTKRTVINPNETSSEAKTGLATQPIKVEEPKFEEPQTQDSQVQAPQSQVSQPEGQKNEEHPIVQTQAEATIDAETELRIKKLEATDPITLPLKTSCDKQAKAKVYEIFGRFKMFPDYTTVQLGVNDFYSICSVKDQEDSFMGEGRGSNKKIAEQIAATEALDNDRLKGLVEERNKEVEKLLGVKMEDLNGESEVVDEVDSYEHFQPQEDVEELPIYDTCDKSSMARLYALMGPYRLFPEYESVQQAPNVFHSICKIKSTAVVLSEGRGTSKKISQQIAAEKAITSQELADFLSEIPPEE